MAEATRQKLKDLFGLETTLEEIPDPTRRQLQSKWVICKVDSYSRAKIESRAYEIYLDRGATHGRALDDWLSAEQAVLPIWAERPETALGLLKGLPSDKKGIFGDWPVNPKRGNLGPTC